MTPEEENRFEEIVRWLIANAEYEVIGKPEDHVVRDINPINWDNYKFIVDDSCPS